MNDYEIIVKGLRQMLNAFAERICVVEEAAGGTPDGPADMALFDTFAGRRHALSRVRAMVNDRGIDTVVLYTWDAPPAFVADASDNGVDGIILKSETGEQLVELLERIHRGERVGLSRRGRSTAERSLSEREREVLALIAQGATNAEIADELYLSIDTIKTHVRGVLRKLDAVNRTQAALKAREYHVAPPPGRIRHARR